MTDYNLAERLERLRFEQEQGRINVAYKQAQIDAEKREATINAEQAEMARRAAAIEASRMAIRFVNWALYNGIPPRILKENQEEKIDKKLLGIKYSTELVRRNVPVAKAWPIVTSEPRVEFTTGRAWGESFDQPREVSPAVTTWLGRSLGSDVTVAGYIHRYSWQRRDEYDFVISTPLKLITQDDVFYGATTEEIANKALDLALRHNLDLENF